VDETAPSPVDLADAKAYFEQTPDYYGLKLVEEVGGWRELVARYLVQHDDYWHRVLAKGPSLRDESPSCPCEVCRDATLALGGT
jgi:hypothetical protein